MMTGREIVGLVYGALGLLFIVGGRLVHFFQRPELTEMQALRAMWLQWVIGVVLIVAAMYMLGTFDKRGPDGRRTIRR